jgi:hypothetical protein
MKPYCTQNNGDCLTCSLVNYNRDCQNNPIHGGKREGAGNKPIDNPLPVKSIRCTSDELKQLKLYLKQIRNNLK